MNARRGGPGAVRANAVGLEALGERWLRVRQREQPPEVVRTDPVHAREHEHLAPPARHLADTDLEGVRPARDRRTDADTPAATRAHADRGVAPAPAERGGGLLAEHRQRAAAAGAAAGDPGAQGELLALLDAVRGR